MRCISVLLSGVEDVGGTGVLADGPGGEASPAAGLASVAAAEMFAFVFMIAANGRDEDDEGGIEGGSGVAGEIGGCMPPLALFSDNAEIETSVEMRGWEGGAGEGDAVVGDVNMPEKCVGNSRAGRIRWGVECSKIRDVGGWEGRHRWANAW